MSQSAQCWPALPCVSCSLWKSWLSKCGPSHYILPSCDTPGVSIISSFCFMKALRGRSQDMYIIARNELIYCTKNKKDQMSSPNNCWVLCFCLTNENYTCCQMLPKACQINCLCITTYQLHAVSNKSNIRVEKWVSESPHQEWGLRKVTHQHLIKFHEVDTP